MENNVEARVKELVTDFKLEEALDVLIAQAQTQNQRKQNALLVLKGKLALLEEQNLSGMLDPSDLARQKAAIAHQILDIADGSPLDHEIPTPGTTRPEKVLVQKTVTASGGTSWMKYLLLAALLLASVLVGIFIAKSGSEKAKPDSTAQRSEPNPSQSPVTDNKPVRDSSPSVPNSGELKILDFPNYRKKFNFLDFQFDFRDVKAEPISDSEIKLTLKYYLTCKSNLGICYRATVRLYADGNPIAPAEQSNLAGWLEHNATITDDIDFVLPADTKTFEIELSRDKSTWKRPFKILR